jgi:antitoxin VapB
MTTILCKESKIFKSNYSQNLRLPAELRFPDNVKSVLVRKVGDELVISPIESIWNSFFFSNDHNVTDDFERGEQLASIRESFDE